jgi:hypothetical protein
LLLRTNDSESTLQASSPNVPTPMSRLLLSNLGNHLQGLGYSSSPYMWADEGRSNYGVHQLSMPWPSQLLSHGGEHPTSGLRAPSEALDGLEHAT